MGLSFVSVFFFYLCSASHFHGGLNYEFVLFFYYSQVFWMWSSLCSHWKVHTDILIKFECVFFPRELTQGLKLRFMAGSACWSVTKSDCEFLSSFFCFLYPFFLLFLGFLWPGTRLAEQHFRVFPSNSDQFKVISAWSGSQAVEKEREWEGGGREGCKKPVHYEGKGTPRLNRTIS